MSIIYESKSKYLANLLNSSVFFGKTIYKYKRQKMFVPTYVFNAFLNRSSDCDEIWYRDILDLGEEDILHFISKIGK